MENSHINNLQSRLKVYLDNIMDDINIKSLYFNIYNNIYSTITKECFHSLRQENELTESCISKYSDSLIMLQHSLSRIYSNENKKLGECLFHNRMLIEENILVCEERFKVDYRDNIYKELKDLSIKYNGHI